MIRMHDYARGLLTVLLLVGATAEAAPFNEAFAPNGRLRAPYLSFARRTGIRPYPVSPAVRDILLNHPLEDAIKILPIPLVLPDIEYDFLQRASQQRARVIAAFFDDVFVSGTKRAVESEAIDEESLQLILGATSVLLHTKSLRRLYERRSIGDISFVYGADFVRRPDGSFVVIEDNVGPIGGIGDIAATHQAFFAAHGQELELRSPLSDAILEFVADVPPERRGEDVIAILNETAAPPPLARRTEDDEDRRKAAILSELGIRVITFDELSADSRGNREIIDALTSGKYRRVINFHSIYAMDISPLLATRLLLAYAEGKFELLTAPGIEFAGHKSLVNLWETLIPFYLHEAPLVHAVPTAGAVQHAEGNDPFPYVYKLGSSEQGRNVHVARHMTEGAWHMLRAEITDRQLSADLISGDGWPAWVAQEFVDTSYLPAERPDSWAQFNVDFRPQVFFVNGRALKPAIWGRAAWKVPGSLNNVSRGAMEVIVSSASLCERALMGHGPEKT